MSLRAGTSIGPYEIVAPLGRGGMGEVYRARDKKLNRDVAIKVLPDLLAADPDQVARQAREAQILATLNHPNIAQVYGVEGHAVVMELVEGEDLSDAIARGPVRLDDALPIARQVADALEAAHELGIIHRDLKPANIKVRPDGTVKVLDFGLAKSVNLAATASSTVTGTGTEQGVVLGTAAYMAPEQARGRAVDKRADIWAFGVVLYEMLTGVRAFRGEGLSDVLAAVVQCEIDWSRLPSDTPPRLRQLIERCLTSDVRQRLRDIGEARVTIAAIEAHQPDIAAAAVRGKTRRWREPMAWTVAAVAVAVAAGSLTRGARVPSPPAPGVMRLSVLPPTGLVMHSDPANMAISHDGRMVAFVVGSGLSIENQLWVRSLDSPVARRLDGANGAAQPFWSPDSRRIGFFAAGKLKVVMADGGPSDIVCDAPFGRGATWNTGDVIVFAPDANSPLYRVSASGGTPVPVTTLDAARKETGHRFPAFLPDGDHFLFAALPGDDRGFTIFAGSLRNAGERTRIGSMGSAPIYAEPGWLIFGRDGALMAQPFDAAALRVTGEPASLGDRPAAAPFPVAYDAGPRASASTTGLLAYPMEPAVDTRLLWMDQAGNAQDTLNVPRGQYAAVAISPDQSRAALVRTDSPSVSSIWVVDLARGGAVPLTTSDGRHDGPVWSFDSTRLVFWSNRDGHRGMYERRVGDAAAPERELLASDTQPILPRSWAAGDVGIIFNRLDPGTRWNVYRLPPSGSVPVPLVQQPSIDVGGWLSPDRRWLAYLSDEAGRLDLYVQSFPSADAKMQVSDEAVQNGWWSSDGRHLLFLKRDRTLWRVDAALDRPSPRIGAPIRVGTFPPGLVAMDLAPDGRMLALVPERVGVVSAQIVQFWREALARR